MARSVTIETLLTFRDLPCDLYADVGSCIATLLKVANSRCQQLVLGAGAITTAGLKSISARHMAVCSQVVLLLQALLPGLRRRLLAGVAGGAAAQLASVLDSVAEVRSSQAQLLQLPSRHGNVEPKLCDCCSALFV